MKLKIYQGMTLIELMITVLIVSIIGAIAVSLYSPYVRKGRRIDAVNALISISLAEEQYRSTQPQYGTLAQVWGGVTASSEGYYTLSITNVSASSYTITAAAIGDQGNDAVDGVSCASIVLSVSNGTVTKSPAACWPT